MAAIPFVDFQREIADLRDEIQAAIDGVFSRGRFILGSEVAALESEMAAWLGRKYVVTCANGTDALSLAMMALEAGPDADVLVPVNTCMPTAVGIRRGGGNPVAVDVDRDTLQMSVDQARKKITASTKVIVPVHLFGNAADVDALREFGLPIIEDCAQAQGATLRGRRVGTLGDLASFSFYPTKNLGAYGDGGAVATDDPVLAERLVSLRQYGQSASGVCESDGMNSRLDEIHAAMLRVKLRHLDRWNESRRRLADLYRERLQSVRVPELLPDSESSRHLFPILSDRRDALRAHLADNGIGTLVHYPVPLHLHPVHRQRWGLGEGAFPIAEEAAKQLISLPMWPYLTEEEVDTVARCVEAFR